MDIPTNVRSFVHYGKGVKIMPNQPKPPTRKKRVDKGKDKVDVLTPRKKGDKGKGKMVMNLISHDQIEKSLHEGSTCYALVTREAVERSRCRSLGTLNQSWKSFPKSSHKICQVSCPPCETSNMLLT